MLKILFIPLLSFIFNANTLYSQWSSQKLSSKRTDVCSCKLGNKIFFIAGSTQTPSTATKTIDILDLITNTWSVKELKTPKSRPNCITYKDKIFVGGGGNALENSKVIEVLDNNGNNIQSIIIPNAIGGLMLEKNGKIYVTSYGDMDVYDIENGNWKNIRIPLSREVSLPRYNYGFVSTDNKIYLAGGGYFGEEYKQVSIFDISQNNWSIDSLSMLRYGLLGETHKDRVYFIGGQGGDYKYYKTIEIFNETTKLWEKDSLSRGGRFDMTTIIHDEKLFVAGGQTFSFSDQFIDLIDVFDFNNKTWSILKLPTGRSSMTAIGAQNKVFFAGGRSDTEDYTDIVDVYEFIPSSIDDSSNFMNIKIYPNPVEEELYIDFSFDKLQGPISLIINNSEGKVLISEILTKSMPISVIGLGSGQYFVNVYDSKRNLILAKSFIKL